MIWSWFLVHLCKMMISPGVFFIFVKFWFFGLLGGKKGKKWPKIKNKYICHMPYLRNSTAYDHAFCYTIVKWWYLQVVFSFFFFFILIFQAVREVKKIVQNYKIFCLLHAHLRNHTSYDCHLWYTCVK